MRGITGWKLNSTKSRLRCQGKNPYIKISSAMGDLLDFPKEVVKNPIAWVISNQSGQTCTLLETILPWHESGLDDQRNLFHWWFLQLSDLEKKFRWISQQSGLIALRRASWLLLPPLSKGVTAFSCLRWHVRDIPAALLPVFPVDHSRLFRTRNVIR